MLFARVVGTVVCTQKVPSWTGHRMLLITPTDSSGTPTGARPLVAIDLVSAAQGQQVFYVRAREAGMALPNTDNPSDATILGIVDEARERPWDASQASPA